MDYAGEPGHLCDAELREVLAAEAAAEMDHRDPETLGEDGGIDRNPGRGLVRCRAHHTRNGHLLPLYGPSGIGMQITKIVYIVGK